VDDSYTYWYRINAYNDVGTSSYSNTSSISFISSASCSGTDSHSYYINGINGTITPYYDGMLPVGGFPESTQPIWDGTFNYKQFTSSCTWRAWVNLDGVGGVTQDVNGHAQNCCSITYNAINVSWDMIMISMIGYGNPFIGFTAEKTTGNDPHGTYNVTYWSGPTSVTSIQVEKNLTASIIHPSASIC
jgi:hypothetical protein